jgi:hypothetical protein
MRNEVVEQLQKRIFGLDGIHIIDLNDITCPIQDFIFNAIAVQRYIDEMDDGINDERNADGGDDAFHVSLDETETEHENGNAHFQEMREIIEYEGPAENFKICLRGTYDQCHESAESP